jgi:DNA-binding CsgD family transcriptional regulator/tetratricopeptide (TPR) repeat protein
VAGQAKSPQRREPRIIERPRLTRQLDECGARTILLVAPAGYGKTTLARQWLANKPHAWCALTPASRDVAALALSVAAAARSIVPEAGTRTQTRLGLSPRPSDEVDVFVDMLATDLSAWPSNAWLAIDDYHSIGGVTDCESIVSGVLAKAPVQLLVTSRSLPSWATSRSRAYGLHCALERDDLAMTDAEASELLSDQRTRDLAKGWPAVVALASSLETVEPQKELGDSEALHSFLAEELLKNAPPKIQRTLFRLSLCPDLSVAQAREILGVGRVASLIDRSARLGLVGTHDGSIAMHPLLRQFVRDWNQARDPNWQREIEIVARALMKSCLWDSAFALIEQLGDERLLEELIAAALKPMLEAGRHATVESWIASSAFARSSVSPWALFAEAELASRRGEQQRAEAIAAQAARTATDRGLAVRAWNLAGRSGHLRDRYHAAIEYHSRAERLASTETERFEAIWGQLVASWQVDQGRAGKLLGALRKSADTSVDAQLRLAGATFHDSLLSGSIANIENQLRECLILTPRTANPLISSSFLTTATRWFVLTGRYDEALRIIEETVALIDEHRLSFALPSALNARAMSLMGLRQWGAASRALDAAQAHAAEFDDAHNQVEANVVRMRLHLARGDTTRAIEASSATWLRDPGPVELFEYEATRDLIFAATATTEAPLVGGEAHETSNAEIRTLRLAANAIRCLRDGRRESGDLELLSDHLMHSGCVDGYVVAYRAYPLLLAAMVHDQPFARFIGPVLLRARDTRIASRVGIQLPKSQKPKLTKRELEVHELLAQGLTNREIARLLYVEEVTVKVHVRHILDKLGVRSRVEAATRVIPN